MRAPSGSKKIWATFIGPLVLPAGIKLLADPVRPFFTTTMAIERSMLGSNSWRSHGPGMVHGRTVLHMPTICAPSGMTHARISVIRADQVLAIPGRLVSERAH